MSLKLITEAGIDISKCSELTDDRVQWRALTLAMLGLRLLWVHRLSLREKVLKMLVLHGNEEAMFYCDNFSK